jgi:hypothetical protein
MNSVCAVWILLEPVPHPTSTEHALCDIRCAWNRHSKSDFGAVTASSPCASPSRTQDFSPHKVHEEGMVQPTPGQMGKWCLKKMCVRLLPHPPPPNHLLPSSKGLLCKDSAEPELETRLGSHWEEAGPWGSKVITVP